MSKPSAKTIVTAAPDCTLEIRRIREEGTETKRFRMASIDAKADEKSRTVELSFSSETNTVQRWCYELGGAVPEILSHAEGAADLQPLIEAGSVLRNHDPNQIVGVPQEVRIDSADKRGKAVIRFGKSTAASEAFQDVSDGILRGVSFGYEPLTEEHIKSGEKNDLGVEGPCIFVRKWRALEISLTPIPADATVGVGRAALAAKNKETKAVKTRSDDKDEDPDLKKKAEEDAAIKKKADEDAKKKEEDEKAKEKAKLPAEIREAARIATREAIKNERERVTQIRAAVKIANLPEDFGDDLIERGADEAEVNREVIKKMGESSPSIRADVGGGNVRVGAERNEKLTRHLTVNLGRRCGIHNDVDKDVERQPMNLQVLGREYLGMIGTPGARNMSNEEVAREVFSQRSAIRAASGNVTSSLSNILANVQNKVLLRAYKKAAPTWRRWCKIGNVPDFKLLSRLKLSDFGDLRETKEDGEIEDSQLIDSNETFRLAWYARKISLTLQMFINDDLDALSRLPALMGQSAARLPSRLVYTHLLANGNMADGTPLFHADHANYNSAASALAAATLQTAIQAFRKQTTFQAPNETVGGVAIPAEPLDVEPEFLLVPPELEVMAKKLVFSPGEVAAESSSGVVNVYKTILKDVIVESRLSHTGYSGYSATGYYVLPNSESIDTFEVGFLDGNEEPRTDTFEDFNRLAMQFRVYLPCVAKALDHRGMHKSVGA